MSKLDPTGESLESILASIRRSLAEQSTDLLEDDGAPASPLDGLGAIIPGEDAPPRFLGNGSGGVPPGDALLPDGRSLAGEPENPPPRAPFPDTQPFAGLEDPPPPAPTGAQSARPAARLEDDPPPPAPAVLAPPQPSPAQKDPLWFLSRPGAMNKKDGAPAAVAAPAQQPAPPNVAPPAADPRPALKEIVRGPLPPFFGSSPEAAKVEVVPSPPMPGPLPGAAIIPPAAPQPAPIVQPPEGDPPRSSPPDSAPQPPAGTSQPAREGAPNGKASSLSGQPAADGAAAPTGGRTQMQGLEAMVAELLRPMLRAWLDENMPRLVSAALKAEADLISRRDPNKP